MSLRSTGEQLPLDAVDGVDPSDAHEHHHLQLGFSVTFSGVEAIKGEPSGTLLRQLCELVWQTIGRIEKATSEHLAAISADIGGG
jgi:hypothetical protein